MINQLPVYLLIAIDFDGIKKNSEICRILTQNKVTSCSKTLLEVTFSRQDVTLF